MSFPTILGGIGGSYIVNQQTTINGSVYTFPSYIVETADDNDVKVDREEIENEAGALDGILYYQRRPEWKGVLKCRIDAAYKTDFPKGKQCTLAGLTTWEVMEATAAKSKSVTKLSVHLLYNGFTSGT